MSTVTISDRTTTEILEDVEKEFRLNFYRMAQHPFLRLIGMERNEANRGSGSPVRPRVKDISKKQVGYQFEIPHLHTAMGNGIHAAAEQAALRSGKYAAARSKATVKFLQGSFIVTEQVIAATRDKEFALAREIVQNSKGALRETHWNANRMLVGNGNGVLCYANGVVSNDTTITVQTNTAGTDEVPPTLHLRQGDQLLVGTSAEIIAGGAVSLVIESITSDTVFESVDAVTLADDDIVIRADAYDTGSAAYTEFTSINQLIAKTGTIQNVNKAENAWFQSRVPTAVGGDFALTDVDDLLLQVRRYADNPSQLIIMGNSTQWQRYSSLLTSTKEIHPDAFSGQVAGGLEGLTVYSPDGALPFWIDDMVPDGVIYVFDPDAFILGEMRPWGFMQDALARDGAMGQRKYGFLEYEFAYAWFAELAQTNAQACGKLTGITGVGS